MTVSLLVAALALGAAEAGAGQPAPRLADAGTADREAVRQVVRAHLSEVVGCYAGEARRTGVADAGARPAGKLKIRWAINAEGKVASVEVLEPLPGASEAFTGCMTDAIRSWRFPPPTAGERAIVTYPFVFRSPTDAGQP
jgi:outer membrane biosynthesis protein TonB